MAPQGRSACGRLSFFPSRSGRDSRPSLPAARLDPGRQLLCRGPVQDRVVSLCCASHRPPASCAAAAHGSIAARKRRAVMLGMNRYAPAFTHDARQRSGSNRERLSGNRHATRRLIRPGVVTENRILVVVEAREARVVAPGLLHELELTPDVRVDAEEMTCRRGSQQGTRQAPRRARTAPAVGAR